jgi:hypothetical protein
MKLRVPLLQACGFAAAVHDPTAMSCRHNPSYSLVSVNSTFEAIRNSDVSGFTFDRESFEAIRENVGTFVTNTLIPYSPVVMVLLAPGDRDVGD